MAGLVVSAPMLSTAAAVASTTTAVTGVTLSTHDVTVDGASVSRAVTVTADFVSAQPIVVDQTGCSAGAPTAPWVTVSDASGLYIGTSFVLTGGSTTDGRWTATLPVTSGWNGDWHLIGIGTRPAGGDCAMGVALDWLPAAATDPAYSFHVTGTNPVRVAFIQALDPAAWTASYVTVSGTATLADGTPLAGKVVYTCQEYDCVNGGTVTTDADGTFTSLPVAVGLPNFYGVSDPRVGTFDNPAEFVVRTPISARVGVRLTAHPNRPRVTLGRYIDISGWIGQESIATCNTLRVQRYASGRWHDVPATLRVSAPSLRRVGAFTVWLSDFRFHVRAVARGNVRYRVRVPAQVCDNPGLGADSYTAGVAPTVIVGVR